MIDAQRFVIIGTYLDGSGTSDHVFGPYFKQKAQALANELTAGGWLGMRWTSLPMYRTPWDNFGAAPDPDADT